eukprot:COSAG01_NODE_8803_length_2654_cov_6.132681_4_plen_193_part_00
MSLLHCKHKSYGANEKWYYSNYSVVRSLAQVSPYKTPASGWLAAHTCPTVAQGWRYNAVAVRDACSQDPVPTSWRPSVRVFCSPVPDSPLVEVMRSRKYAKRSGVSGNLWASTFSVHMYLHRHPTRAGNTYSCRFECVYCECRLHTYYDTLGHSSSFARLLCRRLLRFLTPCVWDTSSLCRLPWLASTCFAP